MPAPNRLEPMAGRATAVVLLHLLLGGLLWVLLPLWSKTSRGEAGNEDLTWLAPEAFLARIPDPPPPPPAKAPAPPPAAPPAAVRHDPEPTARVTSVSLAALPPLRAPNKYITLSARLPEVDGPPAPPRPYHPVPDLLDIAAEATARKKNPGLEAVNEALQATFLKEWQAPSPYLVPPGQRSAVVNLSIGRDGSISGATLIKTGAPALNVSIVQLLQAVTKIPATLPSSFRKQSYDLQVNFQIE